MNRIDVFLEGRDRWNPVKSLTTLTSQVAHEYEDRFLIELLQNAYDAHAPGSTGGRVWILLDAASCEASEHGVVYVANTGRPFAWRNFDALSNIAHSSKPPGEGIGNKGLGFRSVLQVCEWPEVYSVHPDNPADESFSGYCFGFAEDADLERLPLSERELALVKSDFSRYLLPVRREPCDPVLNRLRQAGAVTVIRLPLKSENSLQIAEDQLEKLRTSATPVMLFLDRIESLTLEKNDAIGDRSVHVETRKQELLQVDRLSLSGATQAFRVTTAGRTFLVGHRSVPDKAIRDVVLSSVKAQQLDESWQNWEGDGEVAVAVPVDDHYGGMGVAQRVKFATYTFLPMEVESPFGGHLNAPFYTKLARIDLSEEVGLNTFLLDTAADMACELALALRDQPSVLGDPTAGAVVDLLTWQGRHTERIRRAFQERGLTLHETPWVPAADIATGFVALRTARLWNDRFIKLTPAALAATGVHIINPTLGERREKRLAALASQLAGGMDIHPGDEEVADWAERIAAQMHSQAASIVAWRGLYADLLGYYGQSARARALQGKKILLDQGGQLRRAGPWDDTRLTRDPTVFLPPRRVADDPDELADDVGVDEEEFQIPQRLQRAVAFLHEEISTPDRSEESSRRTTRNAAVEMLEVAKLVERFDRHAMFRHIRRMLAGKVSDGTRSEALRWVYLQHRSARQGLRGLAQLNLRVPTRSGWIPAEEAFFSNGWPGTPPQLERLLAQEWTADGSLAWVRDRLILAPKEWPFTARDVEPFRDFLALVGVRNGLWPMPLRHEPIDQDGYQYKPEAVADRFGLEEPTRAQWVQHVKSGWHGYREFAHPYTPYRSDDTLWLLPGQERFAQMDETARRWFATLVTQTVGAWDTSVWTFEFRRERPSHRRVPDPQVWPSPLASFIGRAKWFPMTELGRREAPQFVTVGQGWCFVEEQGDRPPRFARMPPHDVRRALESLSSRQALVNRGLRIWNDVASAEARLDELADVLTSGAVTASERSAFRHACEAAWSDAVTRGHLDNPAQLRLVASRGRDFSVIEPATAEAPSRVLLPSAGGSVGAELVESMDQDVLLCDPADARSIEGLLTERTDLQLRRLADAEIQVFADGVEIRPDANHPLLLNLTGEWVAGVVALAVALQASPFRRVTDRTVNDALTVLRRTRLVFGSSLTLRVDGGLVSPSTTRQHLQIDDPLAPVMLLRNEEEAVSWDAMDAMSDGLATLIGEPGATDGLRAAVLALAKARGDRWEEPNLDDLAAAFRVSTHRVSDVLASLRGALDQMVHTLLPALAALTDLEFALEVETGMYRDRDSLAQALVTRLTPLEVETVLTRVESGQQGDELRTSLEIPLGSFNRALRDLGRPPIHYTGQHEAAWAHFLNSQRRWLSQRLRRHFLRRFQATDDLSSYAELRHLPGLGPDPQWLDEYETPPDDVMRSRCDAWLADHHIPTPADDERSAQELPDLDQVREANQRLLDMALPRLTALWGAWLKKHDAPDAGLGGPELVREKLLDSGCLDFSAHTDDSLLPWLVHMRLWPQGMPASLSPAICGLDHHDFNDEQGERRRGVGTKDPRKGVIPFNGHDFSVDFDRLRELAETARASVDEQFLSTTKRQVHLSDIPSRHGGNRGNRGGGGSKGRYPSENQLSEDQKRAIGLVGEVLAFEWLKHTYPEVNDDSWISGYRSLTVGGYEGDDQRGYDFEVRLASQLLKYEVKAKVGDDLTFELGASELRAARAARRGSYRIIFIQNVLESESRRLMVLPNPLEPESSTRFRQANSGIRFSFDLPARRKGD